MRRVLVVNAGSSSLKLRVLREDGDVTAAADLPAVDDDGDGTGSAAVKSAIESFGPVDAAGHVRQLMADKRISARAYTREHGEDAPEINEWKWLY